jgi:hypothetical protein
LPLQSAAEYFPWLFPGTEGGVRMISGPLSRLRKEYLFLIEAGLKRLIAGRGSCG